MDSYQGTREHILHLIRVKGLLTAKALSEYLEISLSAVRQQLAILQEEGLLSPSKERAGPGRPLHHYELTEEAERVFKKSYDSVALDMIDGLVELDGVGKLKHLLELRRKKIHVAYQAEMEGLSQEEKWEKMAELQNRNGYMARIEKKNGLPVIHEHNCPLKNVANKYLVFCESERQLYQDLLGEDVELSSCRAKGDFECVFQPKKKLA